MMILPIVKASTVYYLTDSTTTTEYNINTLKIVLLSNMWYICPAGAEEMILKPRERVLICCGELAARGQLGNSSLYF